MSVFYHNPSSWQKYLLVLQGNMLVSQKLPSFNEICSSLSSVNCSTGASFLSILLPIFLARSAHSGLKPTSPVSPEIGNRSSGIGPVATVVTGISRNRSPVVICPIRSRRPIRWKHQACSISPRIPRSTNALPFFYSIYLLYLDLSLS